MSSTLIFFPLILVFILTFYVIGMILGLAGSIGGPTKKTGGCCLCTGTAIFFIFSSILWFITVVFFLIGSLSDHLVCKTFQDPNGSELSSWTNSYMNDFLNENFLPKNGRFNLSLGGILEDCRRNQSLYNTLTLTSTKRKKSCTC